MKIMNSKRNKYLIVTALCLSSIYTGAWFYVANSIKKTLNNFAYQTEDQGLSLGQTDVSGFPFKITVQAKDFKFRTKFSGNSIIKAGLSYSADSFEASTNILFNSFKLSFPKKSSVSFHYDDKISEYDITSNENHYLEIKDSSFIKTHKIISAILKSENLSFEDFQIDSVKYYSEGSAFFEKNTNNQIFQNSNNLEALYSYKADRLISLDLKTDNKTKIIDSKYLGYEIQNINNKLDAAITFKPNKEESSIQGVNLGLMEVEVDNFSFQVNGAAKRENNQLNIDFNIKLKEFDSLIAKFTKPENASNNKYEIIKNLVKEVAGKDDVNEAEIKIYSSKDGSIRIENTDFNGISNHLQQLFMSN